MRPLVAMNWRQAVNHYLNMGCSQLIDVETTCLSRCRQHFHTQFVRWIHWYLDSNFICHKLSIYLNITFFLFFVLRTGSAVNNLAVQRMVWSFIGHTPLYKPTKCYSSRTHAYVVVLHLSFSCAFSWNNMMLISWFEFHLNSFLDARLTIYQLWLK